MKIDKEKLVKNLIIFVVMAVVITILTHFMMPGAGIGSLLIGGLSFSVMLWFPIRFFPTVRLLGSFIMLVVIVVVYIAFVQFLGDIGAILAFILLIAAFIGSFFVL